MTIQWLDWYETDSVCEQAVLEYYKGVGKWQELDDAIDEALHATFISIHNRMIPDRLDNSSGDISWNLIDHLLDYLYDNMPEAQAIRDQIDERNERKRTEGGEE